jgi:hypothetical protein
LLQQCVLGDSRGNTRGGSVLDGLTCLPFEDHGVANHTPQQWVAEESGGQDVECARGESVIIIEHQNGFAFGGGEPHIQSSWFSTVLLVDDSEAILAIQSI